MVSGVEVHHTVDLAVCPGERLHLHEKGLPNLYNGSEGLAAALYLPHNLSLSMRVPHLTSILPSLLPSFSLAPPPQKTLQH